MNLLLNIFLIFLALAGLRLSVFIWHKKQYNQKITCPLKSDCSVVIYSKHSKFLSVPVEVIGICYYGTIALAYIFFLTKIFNDNLFIDFLLLTSSTLAFIFSLYLTFIQIFRLKQLCFWCLVSVLLCTIIFICTIFSSSFIFTNFLN
ncbi:MAG: vitamin K epoxide reductase family protein [Candidatus Staskawiczbacteria bacterium]|nr:vitamin K epoxide reductase family protein [Candidatus Staskawiczbacteria bacterium]